VTSLKKYWFGILLFVLLAAANWFIAERERVEYWYAEGAYVYISLMLRWMFGSLPFSLGDTLYLLLIFLFIKWLVGLIRAISSSSQKLKQVVFGLRQLVFFLVTSWLVFHFLWGFNYYRQSILDRFRLSKEKVTEAELVNFAHYSLVETNRYAKGRRDTYTRSSTASIFLAYDSLLNKYPSFELGNHSYKSSLFGVIGNYMGYGGYYNPLTGEAQINDAMPSFLLPFIGLHEVAHQLGNAKESEANFIGYLAAMQSTDSSLLYSANLELFMYSASALKRSDSMAAKKLFDVLSPIAKQDLKIYEKFIQQYHGPVDQFVDYFYSGFLRFNNQPEGMYGYNKGMIYVMRYLQKKGLLSRPL
jgi:hypothetical protein